MPSPPPAILSSGKQPVVAVAAAVAATCVIIVDWNERMNEWVRYDVTSTWWRRCCLVALSMRMIFSRIVSACQYISCFFGRIIVVAIIGTSKTCYKKEAYSEKRVCLYRRQNYHFCVAVFFFGTKCDKNWYGSCVRKKNAWLNLSSSNDWLYITHVLSPINARQTSIN